MLGVLADCHPGAANTDAFRAVVREALDSDSNISQLRFLTAAGGVVLAETQMWLQRHSSSTSRIIWKALRQQAEDGVMPEIEETRQSDDPIVVMIELLLVGRFGPRGILNGCEGVALE